MPRYSFDYETVASRILFGPGRRREAGTEAARLGARRVFLIARPGLDGLETVTDSLGRRLAHHWREVAQHVPVPLAERARDAAAGSGADGVVSVGGGSATGLAKAVALTRHIPIIAVPTTYAGSELTAIYGLTGGAAKHTGVAPQVRPVTVLYDPELTTSLPAAVTGPSVFNALAHCCAALWSERASPVTSALALEAVRQLSTALSAAIRQPGDLETRSRLQLGAYLAGSALSVTGTGLNHRISHILGGRFGLVHADTHSAVLPHVVALNAPAVPGEMRQLATALGDPGTHPAIQLWQLARATAVATKQLSSQVDQSDLDDIALQITGSPNPVPVTRAVADRLLEGVLHGRQPSDIAHITS